jgi:hypothetical protein
MDTKGKKLVLKTLTERRTPSHEDPYDVKLFNRGLGALVHHQGVPVQLAILLLRFQPRAGLNQY